MKTSKSKSDIQPNLTAPKRTKKGTLQKSLDASIYSSLPQISTIPGISPKEKNRYRVMLGDEVLGDFLSVEEAILLAQGGTG